MNNLLAIEILKKFTSLSYKETENKKINNLYKSFLEEYKSKNSCSACKLNRLKTKYLTLIKENL